MGRNSNPTPTMEPDSTKTLKSPWPNLTPELLHKISTLVDPTLGTLRLRSICHQWRSSLSPFYPPPTPFPLLLPFPNYPSPSTPTPTPTPPPSRHVTLLEHSIFFLYPPNTPSCGSLIKLHSTPTSFSLLDPICGATLPTQPNFVLNLLDYSIIFVSKSYSFDPIVDVLNPIKKVVVSWSFDRGKDRGFALLGLCYDGGLLFWRYGDSIWTPIVLNGRVFDDVISYEGKFYATADGKGRLVVIDSRLKPVDLVRGLFYGDGKVTHLVESDGCLYLVDRVRSDQGSRFGVFKLDEKGRFWDYELNLNGSVFFICNDVNFALSKSICDGCVRDCIYFMVNPTESCAEHGAFDVVKGIVSFLDDGSNPFARICWPSWCDEGQQDDWMMD